MDSVDLDALTTEELLALHREVCRRAGKIYSIRYKQVRDRNFEAAMAVRDTRFVKGLSVLENCNRFRRWSYRT